MFSTRPDGAGQSGRPGWAGRWAGWRPTRRQALRAAAGGATAVAGGAVLAACGGTSATAGSSTSQAGILPVPTSGVVQLVFQPNQQFIGWNETTRTIFQEFVDQHFNTNPKFKGLWASIWPSGWGGGSTQIAATIAGKGYADVMMMCCSDIPLLEQSGILQSLDDLLRRDNIDTNNWSKGHLLADSYNGLLYGLPSYDGTTCFFYRQDILDQLGLPYPTSDWTGAEAAQLWTKCAGKASNGALRYGASFYYDPGSIQFWLKGWGASFGNADLTKATMGTPQGADAVSYVMDLYQAKAAYTGGQDIGILPTGKAVFAMYHSAHVIDVGVRGLGEKFKWNIMPSPIWQTQRSCFETIDCYMLNAEGKHVDDAWTLLKWISGVGDAGAGQAWPKFQIDISLVTPSLVSLWDYWETTITAVAPPLKNKDIKWFYDAAAKGYNYPTQYFKYQPLQANTIVGNWMTSIQSQKVDPAGGLLQMQQQVNALEATGAQESQALTQTSKNFPTTGAAEAAMPTGI